MLNYIHDGKDYSFTVAAIYRLWRKGTIATPHVAGLLQTRAKLEPRAANNLARIWDKSKAREQGYV
jgi:hypothetical protein